MAETLFAGRCVDGDIALCEAALSTQCFLKLVELGVPFPRNRYGEYIGYIDKYTSNWDVERIAFMDNLIMAAATAELLSFPSIPIKVTLDEYIEIAKYYSTPGSSVFINGVLDKIVEELTAEGRIRKSGRGLLEQ